MYIATISTPGYLPDTTDDPPIFDTAREAWEYLYHERNSDEWDREPFEVEGEEHDHGPYTLCSVCSEREDSETGDALYANAIGGILVGTVYGPTPGYDGDHDLGIAYSVTEVED